MQNQIECTIIIKLAARLMSKDRQNLLKEDTIIKREKHLRLMTKDRQNLLKEDTIIKTETHLRLMSEDMQNLLNEETIIKRRKTVTICNLLQSKLHETQVNLIVHGALILVRIRIST